RVLFRSIQPRDRLSASIFGSAPGACRCCRSEFDPTIEFKAHFRKIHFNGLDFLQKFFIHNIFETINFKNLVAILRLIQSHRK
ncbi:MAG: hypothetical protein KKE59_03455, partial [Proteobacteria bacterium]|nr:hypothetical protein [Pseudomonadota bacterium]